MRRRVRLILPSGPWIVGAALVYLASEVPEVIFLWTVGLRLPGANRPLDGAAVLLIAAYGIYRVDGFHPALREGYRRWLESTPWAWPRALPWGPVHLVWEDAIVLGALIAPVAWRGDIRPAAAVVVFLGAYLAALARVLVATGARAFAVAIGFALAGVVRLGGGFAESGAVASVLVAAGAAIVGLVGLRRSLRNYPWDESTLRAFQPRPAAEVEAEAVRAGRNLGWPHDRLGPKAADPPKAIVPRAFVAATLIGWITYCVAHWGPEAERAQLGGLLAVVYPAASALRLTTYLIGHEPPISIVGRLATGRWVVPGYDKVVVGPAAATVLGLMVRHELIAVAVDPILAASAGLAACLFVLGAAPPDLATWRLTGRHRVASSANKAGGYVQAG